MFSSRFYRDHFVVLLVILSAGCIEHKTKNSYNNTVIPIEALVIEHYAQMAAQSYVDNLQAAVFLQHAIESFTEAPSIYSHDLAKQAWLNARRVYGQTEVYRFYGGPIDDVRGLEAKINAWPIDEAYLDYVQSFDGQGILSGGMINDAEQPITSDYIIEANERGGEKNISMGFHAIEFLLWGQDVSTVTAGQRSFHDYLSTNSNNIRRSEYLKLLADLLVQHMHQLVQDWSSELKNNYRTRFINDPNALVYILTGMQVLAGNELAGERLEVALATADQEDEHSCFSDNTHVDIAMNIKGIMNVYSGNYISEYGRLINGPGIAVWLNEYAPIEGQKVQSILEQAVIYSNQIMPPFDQAVNDDLQRENIQRLVQQLRLFSRLVKSLQWAIRRADNV